MAIILRYCKRRTAPPSNAGLKYVNNDACYPAIMTVGQLVEAIKSRRYDPDSTALAISQTGGMCRATNYFALIRKALVDAGYRRSR